MSRSVAREYRDQGALLLGGPWSAQLVDVAQEDVQIDKEETRQCGLVELPAVASPSMWSREAPKLRTRVRVSRSDFPRLVFWSPAGAAKWSSRALGGRSAGAVPMTPSHSPHPQPPPQVSQGQGRLTGVAGLRPPSL